jgi:exodeoxyribonuclease VII large subunit
MADAKPKVLTVSQVNKLVAGMLGEYFSDVWIEGEISNFKAYPSGHLYFALKDEASQIAAVCFRQAAARLKFELEDGLLVVGHGRLDVYPASGKYQVILDSMEPKGLGALQKAFEQLKKKLDAEGLFDEKRKRPIPALPRALGIVTSPAGAAIHDMLKTLRLHKAHLKVVLYPCAVQGEGAAEQIAEGIAVLNRRDDVEVIIAGRGGGSIEDLWAFNEEVVARAIAGSRVPVISAVGHEVDFTIADFVADVRAATPTAAAQLVSRGWEELETRLADNASAMLDAWQQAVLDREQRLDELIRHRGFEVVSRRLAEVQLRLERLASTIATRVRTRLTDSLARLTRSDEQLGRRNPVARVLRGRVRQQALAGQLEQAEREGRRRRLERLRAAVGRIEPPVQLGVRRDSGALAGAAAKLDALSPLASLGRGYSICLKPDGAIVSRVGQVRTGDEVSVRVSDGSFPARVGDSTTKPVPSAAEGTQRHEENQRQHNEGGRMKSERGGQESLFGGGENGG